MSYQLRATIPDDLAKQIKTLGAKEVRTESNMTEVLLREALAARNKKREKVA